MTTIDRVCGNTQQRTLEQRRKKEKRIRKRSRTRKGELRGDSFTVSCTHSKPNEIRRVRTLFN